MIPIKYKHIQLANYHTNLMKNCLKLSNIEQLSEFKGIGEKVEKEEKDGNLFRKELMQLK